MVAGHSSNEVLLEVGRELRRRGFTTYRLAQILGVLRHDVSALMRERRGWTPALMATVAQLLGLPQAQLFPGDGWGQPWGIEMEMVRRGLNSKGWLAKELGISAGLLSKMLEGRRIWQPERKRKAAEVLGVPEERLFAPVWVGPEEASDG